MFGAYPIMAECTGFMNRVNHQSLGVMVEGQLLFVITQVGAGGYVAGEYRYLIWIRSTRQDRVIANAFGAQGNRR